MSRCERPDRDVAELVCGHPLPCPWHTVIIDTRTHPPSLKIPITAAPAMRPKVLKVLKEIGLAITKEMP